MYSMLYTKKNREVEENTRIAVFIYVIYRETSKQ